MFQYVSAVGIVATIMTLLMVTAMLYLVWGALGNSAHTPSPDDGDQPELGEGDDADETQGELAADSNSA
ncbi:hypothetical protein [Halorubrum lacusprofundi]|jgi:hypothetical protein|uniref:Uncharacterized protein n=1 Tax=Halorubrum lacusprofundi (strain ATCC 49239 / DSM 5036 / JCM 8891 / ACAM 34) TaxID=416348 RepID=B9LU91_HALLT|nr:hypothetical protein [Halorubrum lacusprofundi]ACM58285.1 hypothetical protein Hlac_2714 [Halorubrum lacusprofundi ATCC 49239]MCG1006367.1 hypothetical protein [Halorubrum lacusprofundi]